MFDSLNKLGLPLKYAILGSFGCLLGVFIAGMIGVSATGYIPSFIGGGIGGAIAGLIRKRRGMTR